MSETNCASIRRSAYASPAKQVSALVTRIQNAVAKENKHIPRLHFEAELVVVGIVEKSQRQTGRFDHMILSGMDVDGARQARIGDQQGSMCVVPDGVDE